MDQTVQDLKDCQQILDAVSAVLKLEATLVNNQMVRIAGTGPCRHRIGEQIHPDSAFGQALRSGSTVRVDNPRTDDICKDCGLRSLCQETAHLANPIFGDKPVGVLGLVAFNEMQKEQLLHGLDGYSDFLTKISRLIGDLLYTRGTLQAVSNSVSEGLAATNEKGVLTFINRSAEQLLGIPSGETPTHVTDLPGIGAIFRNMWAEGETFTGNDFTVEIPKPSVTLSGKIQPIQVMDRAEGALINFRQVNPERQAPGFERMIYKSSQMDKVIRQAQRVAPSDATVLLEGESGTGKELFARGIHESSPRKEGPFVAINCAAIPENLLESELFGYAAGAFTGARKGGKQGKFEMANNGTLFLDEIGEMPPAMQAKLLRVLEDRLVTRVGGMRSTKLNVRIVSATNQNLENLVERRAFREDLFYRINVVQLEIPPLRERADDIFLLANNFLRQNTENSLSISSETKKTLLGYSWPGNVRELENAMEHAAIMSEGHTIDPEHLPRRISLKADKKTDQIEQSSLTSLKELERKELQQGIKKYGTGDTAISRIAMELGISRSTIYRRLKEYGLS